MFKPLQNRLTNRFSPGTYALSLLYDEVMDQLGLSGKEGEEAAQLVIGALEYEGLLEQRPPDKFVMIDYEEQHESKSR